jgi:uncharacterized OsmC-like protein
VGPETLRAVVEGEIEASERVLRIARVRVRYSLRIPRGKRDAAERALATHEQRCPAATSVRGCIPIEIAADIEEEGDTPTPTSRP